MIINPAVIGLPIVPGPDIPRIMNDNGGIVPPWLIPSEPKVPSPPSAG